MSIALVLHFTFKPIRIRMPEFMYDFSVWEANSSSIKPCNLLKKKLYVSYLLSILVSLFRRRKFPFRKLSLLFLRHLEKV